MMLSGCSSSGVVVDSNESRTSQEDEVELEAAEVLTCLAHHHHHSHSNSNSMPTLHNHDVQTRPSNSLSRHPSANNHLCYLLSEQHHNRRRTSEDPAVVVQKHCEMTSNMTTKPIQSVQMNEELEPNRVGSYTPSMGTKTRKNFDEAEKEARRVFRVLANRESARQTIRRRQALYEELTRKAADLAWENGTLKKEKELATKEYDSLRSTNESLKAQIANITRVEVASPRGDMRLSNNEIPTSPSTHYPIYVYNQQPSLFPSIWPSVDAPSNVVQLQCISQSGIAIPSQVPVLMSDESHSSTDQGTLTRINVPRAPFYVLPCPWLPFSLPATGLHTQSFDSSVKQKDIVLNNDPRSSSSSKTIAHVEKYDGFPLMKMMSKACNSATSLHENLSSHLPGGGGQHLRPKSGGGVIMPVPVRNFKAAGVEHKNISQTELSCEIEGTPAAAVYPKEGVLEKEPVVSKKQLDSVAAAEARKRRKELKKLKDLHTRQFRSSC